MLNRALNHFHLSGICGSDPLLPTQLCWTIWSTVQSSVRRRVQFEQHGVQHFNLGCTFFVLFLSAHCGQRCITSLRPLLSEDTGSTVNCLLWLLLLGFESARTFADLALQPCSARVYVIKSLHCHRWWKFNLTFSLWDKALFNKTISQCHHYRCLYFLTPLSFSPQPLLPVSSHLSAPWCWRSLTKGLKGSSIKKKGEQVEMAE